MPLSNSYRLAPVLLVAAALLAFSLPFAASAQEYHCDACSCNCNSLETDIGEVTTLWPGDGRDPEGICVEACRDRCGRSLESVEVPDLRTSDPSDTRTITSGVATGDFVGRGVSCTPVEDAPETPAGTGETGEDSGPAPRTPSDFGYRNPLGTTNVNQIINRVIRAALGVVGAIFLAMFIWGGVLWMTATGEPDKVKKAKSALLNAVIGMTVIALSYTILNVLFGIAGSLVS